MTAEMKRNLGRHRPVRIHPLVALDARLAIEHLSARSAGFSQAAKDRPDSPHVTTWAFAATLLAGEARSIATAVVDALNAIDKRMDLS